ncbi:MAG: DUF4838 domain-containing protein [Candidatus Zipacnadales bacterium]
MKLVLLCSHMAAIWVAVSTLADAFPLARNGQPAATIVLAERPTLAAEVAAEELRSHVQLISGALLPITSEVEKVHGPRILIGESQATIALGLRSADFDSQEYLIRVRPETLVLIGRDEPPDTDPNAPTYADGKYGKALCFDGVDDVIVVPDCGFSDEAGSLECWVYLPAQPQEHESTILRLDGTDPWSYHIIRRWPHTCSLGYTTYNGEVCSNVSSPELAPGWHHVLATYDTQTAVQEFFVDGVSCGQSKYLITTCKQAALNVGGIGGGTVGNPFAGLLDEVRVSTVVRSPQAATGGPYEPDAATVVLMHCDEGQGRPRDSSGRGVTRLDLPDWYEERGTLNAVYDFLERFCGVRWYMPTEIGTCYPRLPTLTVRGHDVRRAPRMAYRWITPTNLYLPTSDNPVSSRANTLWRLRMRLGGRPFWVCHSFGGYYDRFYKDHPDWFAQGQGDHPSQPCFTSPGFIAQVVQDARDFFDGKGAAPGTGAMGDIFPLVPMDDNRWCKCERCQAQLDAKEATNPQFTNGHASRYIWTFVNKVAREVRQTHPDKWIGALAYWEYGYYPEGIELEPNIIVQMCLHTRNWWCPSMEVNDRKVFDTWVQREGKRRPLYLWLYYCFPALQSYWGKYNSFPSYFAHTAVQQMRMYHEAGIQGIFIEHSSEFGQTHLMDVPDLYVTLKLADDPSLDGEKLIDEFFSRFYGAAAEPLQRLYESIEQTYIRPSSYPPEIQKSPAHHHQTQELAWKWLGTEERMAEWSQLMEQAKRLAHTDLEKQRVALFERGMWEYMVEGKRQYEALAAQAAP